MKAVKAIFYLCHDQNSPSHEDEGLSINIFSEIKQWILFTTLIKALWLILEVSTTRVWDEQERKKLLLSNYKAKSQYWTKLSSSIYSFPQISI